MSEENIQQQSTGAAAAVLDPVTLTQPLASAVIWLRVLAVSYGLVGLGFMASIVGIVIAWMPIWFAVECWFTASGINAVLHNNDPAEMTDMYGHIHRTFMLQGVYVYLLVIVFLFSIVLAIVVGAMQPHM